MLNHIIPTSLSIAQHCTFTHPQYENFEKENRKIGIFCVVSLTLPQGLKNLFFPDMTSHFYIYNIAATGNSRWLQLRAEERGNFFFLTASKELET